jgi:hypothetical protein
MKLFKRVSEKERPLNDRRRDRIERLRQQREIEEEHRRRIRAVRPDLGPLSLW